MKRILVVAAAAGAGVAAYLLLRSPPGSGVTRPDRRTLPPETGVTRPDRRTDLATPDASGVRPSGRVTPDPEVTPDPDAGSGSGTVGDTAMPSAVFEQEVRDGAWAEEQEREMTLRLRRVVDDLAERGTPVDVDGIECRRTQCRVALHARDAAGLGKLYGSLESVDGLYGWADNLLLDNVDTALDGQVTTRVTAIFERE